MYATQLRQVTLEQCRQGMWGTLERIWNTGRSSNKVWIQVQISVGLSLNMLFVSLVKKKHIKNADNNNKIILRLTNIRHEIEWMAIAAKAQWSCRIMDVSCWEKLPTWVGCKAMNFFILIWNRLDDLLSHDYDIMDATRTPIAYTANSGEVTKGLPSLWLMLPWCSCSPVTAS